jgi:hypothetical protein
MPRRLPQDDHVVGIAARHALLICRFSDARHGAPPNNPVMRGYISPW